MISVEVEDTSTPGMLWWQRVPAYRCSQIALVKCYGGRCPQVGDLMRTSWNMACCRHVFIIITCTNCFHVAIMSCSPSTMWWPTNSLYMQLSGELYVSTLGYVWNGYHSSFPSLHNFYSVAYVSVFSRTCSSHGRARMLMADGLECIEPN